MLALAQVVAQHVAQRPQLAIYLATPYADRGDWLIVGGQKNQETAEILDIAVRLGSDEGALNDAADVALNAKDEARNYWKAIAYLLQETRFRDGRSWAHRNIASAFVRQEPAWALRHALKAVADDSKDEHANYYLAASYYNTRQYALAEKYYLVAIEDEDTDKRQASLRELVSMWTFDPGRERKAGAQKARPYLDRLLKEYPEDGYGWMFRVASDSMIHGSTSEEVIRNFLRYADRNDPRQAQLVDELERVRKHPVIRSK